MNWHKHQLKLIAVQYVGDGAKITAALNEGATKFFKGQAEKNDVDSFTGRMK